MKIFLKFDHESNDVLKAIDCPFTIDQVNDFVNDLAVEFSTRRDIQTQSQLSEIIDKRLDYSVILFMATESLKTKIVMAGMGEFLSDKFLGSDDDE